MRKDPTYLATKNGYEVEEQILGTRSGSVRIRDQALWKGALYGKIAVLGRPAGWINARITVGMGGGRSLEKRNWKKVNLAYHKTWVRTLRSVTHRTERLRRKKVRQG